MRAGGWDEDRRCMPPHGISRATVEALRVKYGGARVAQARRLKVLEEQYGLIKRLLPDAMLDNAVLNEVAGKLVEFAAQWGGLSRMLDSYTAPASVGVYHLRRRRNVGSLAVPALE